MDIKLGADVIAQDGRAGTVERLIVHPQTREIEGLVAAEGGLLKGDVVIPIDRVIDAAGDEVRVRGTAAEIGDLEPFSMSQYTEPPEDWLPPTDSPSSFLLPRSPYTVGAFVPPQPEISDRGIEDLDPGDVDVRTGTEALTRDGVAGRLERVITEAGSDKISHLIIHRGLFPARHIAVPYDLVESMDEHTVRLALTAEELDALPDARVG